MTGVDTPVSRPGDDGPLSAPVVAALETAWTAIRTQHPQVPAAVIVVGAGSGGPSRDGLKLGHFAAMRWTDTTQQPADEERARRLPEVFIGGEGLARGPVDVLATLLHEAAHALAHTRGIKDTSRQGRWHNAKFKALAEELGIDVSKDPRIGWSPTSLPADIHDRYAETIAALGQALRLHRAVEVPAERKRQPGPPPCVCQCGRRIRVAPRVLDTGPITCGICGTDFEPQPADEEEA